MQPESLRFILQMVNCSSLLGDVKVSWMRLTHALTRTCGSFQVLVLLAALVFKLSSLFYLYSTGLYTVLQPLP